MGHQHGGHRGVKLAERAVYERLDQLHGLAVQRLGVEIAEVAVAQHERPGEPGEADNLHRARDRLYRIEARLLRYGDAGNTQGAVYLDAVGALPGVGYVVIAYYNKGRQIGGGQAADAAGELALDGGRRIAVLEDIARDDGQVNVVFERPVYSLIKRFEEVSQ